MDLSSWSGAVASAATIWTPNNRHELVPGMGRWPGMGPVGVVHGNGRSYSDVALPTPGGAVLRTREMCHVVGFDRSLGIMEVEAGASLWSIQELALPAGWGLSVLPGTSRATVGGALANDVHGKNHASAGSFSRGVLSARLYRADRGMVELTRADPELWAATVGGLGATGLIATVTLQLSRWASSVIELDQERFVGVSEFLAAAAAAGGHEYAVGWLDTFASPARGVFFRGRVCAEEAAPRARALALSAPLPRVRVINGVVSRAFNAAYWSAHRNGAGIKSGWESFFCPLDRIETWNRLYGPKGFSQFQCVIPTGVAVDAYDEIFKECRRADQGSFLSVIKKFGDVASEGYLSFARPGVTFAMDFPNQDGTVALQARLVRIAMEAGGALYPAKMGIESMDDFERSFPQWASWRAQWDKGGVFAGSAWIARLGL